jgi:hypothetical protein
MWVVLGLMVLVGVGEMSRAVYGEFHLGRRFVWGVLRVRWVRRWMFGGVAAVELERVEEERVRERVEREREMRDLHVY